MGTDAYSQIFRRLLKQLEDWYADSVQATDIRPMGSGSQHPGHVILRANKYPGPDWRKLWDETDDGGRQQILEHLRAEVYGITHAPSQATPASGLYAETQEWRLAIALADGSLRAVARRFGVSHEKVRYLRLKHRGENGN